MTLSVEAIREALHSQPDATHHEGCWQVHGWCAVAYLLHAREELKFTDLKTEVEHSEIRASATSDVLPTDECRHVQSRMLKVFRGYEFIPNEFCPKCGEKL